jgi:hypothetical protein
LLTLPPVSGSVALGDAAGVSAEEGVGVGAGALEEIELEVSGCMAGRLSAAATPIPPVTTTAADAAAIMRARFTSLWASERTSTIGQCDEGDRWYDD